MTMNPGNNPKERGSYQDKINAYFYTGYLLPERDKGFVAVGLQPNDFTKDAPQSLQYPPGIRRVRQAPEVVRSEEHTSELQSLMRISYAVFCLKQKPLPARTPTFFYFIFFSV